MADTGRPSKYKQEYCELAIEMGREGKTIAQIGLACNVAKQTIYTWMKEHPEFLDAIKQSVSFAQAWYEEAGQKGLTADKFNSSLFTKIVSSRFRDDYTDSSTVYTRAVEVKEDDVPHTQIDKLVRDIAKELKDEF